MPHSYYVFYKPYGVLSQFTKEAPHHITLADYLDIPSHIYPVGRLDKDSEGILLLTDDNILKDKLLNPKFKSPKTYLVQVDDEITPEAISRLSSGVTIKHKGKAYDTLPAQVIHVHKPDVPPRNPPVRFRKNIPTSWVEITITEGKNRQVRKMCAAVGFPVLRLIRIQVAGLSFSNLEAGKYRSLTPEEVSRLHKS